ncbi:MAG TPA: hypothetical protein VN153_06735, partial [Tahibacter sp.]|nr:hypothetical protein [Tahibacter sp.]
SGARRADAGTPADTISAVTVDGAGQVQLSATDYDFLVMKLASPDAAPLSTFSGNGSTFIAFDIDATMPPDPAAPIPDSRFPIPDSRFPIPDSRFPIPDSRFPKPPTLTRPRFPCTHRPECRRT